MFILMISSDDHDHDDENKTTMLCGLATNTLSTFEHIQFLSFSNSYFPFRDLNFCSI